MARPWDNGLMAWTYPIDIGAGVQTPAAGVQNCTRCKIRLDQAVVATNIVLIVATGGTGAQLPVNVFAGICDSSGTLLANSSTAALDTAVQTAGQVIAPMTATQLLTPGQDYFIQFVIGTQSTTAVVLRAAGSATNLNVNRSNSTDRGGTVGTGKTAVASFAAGSLVAANTFWAGLS